MLKVARDRLGISYLGHSSLQRPQYGSRSNHLPGGEKNQRLTLPGGEREKETGQGQTQRLEWKWAVGRRRRGSEHRGQGNRGAHSKEGNIDEQLGGMRAV